MNLIGGCPGEIDYDPEGNVISQLDAKLRASQRTYDSLNRLIQEVDSSNGETNGGVKNEVQHLSKNRKVRRWTNTST